MLKVNSRPGSDIHRLSSDGDGRVSVSLCLHADSPGCGKLASTKSGLTEEQPCKLAPLPAVLKVFL